MPKDIRIYISILMIIGLILAAVLVYPDSSPFPLVMMDPVKLEMTINFLVMYELMSAMAGRPSNIQWRTDPYTLAVKTADGKPIIMIRNQLYKLYPITKDKGLAVPVYPADRIPPKSAGPIFISL